MDWARVPTELWETEAANEALAAWTRLTLWKVKQGHETGDCPDVVPARGFPLSSDELAALRASVLVCEGLLVAYPSKDVAGVKAAKEAGKKGGRPRKNPRVKTPSLANEKPQGLNGTETPGPKPDKIREDKIREDKSTKENARPLAVVDEDPFADDQPQDETTTAQCSEQAQWSRFRITRFCQEIKTEGAKVGPGNWRQFQRMRDEHGPEKVLIAVKATRRQNQDLWPDNIEKTLSDGRLDLTAREGDEHAIL